MKRKILLLGRHGISPQKKGGGSYDLITPESITNLYSQGVGLQKILSGTGAIPSTTSIRHTSKDRTRVTALARLVGALGLEPFKRNNPPKNSDDLKNCDISGLEISIDDRFLYGKCSMKAYKEKGPDGVVDFLLANPHATMQMGDEIEPYISLNHRMMNGLQDYVRRILSSNQNFGNLMSHATCIEIPIIGLINSARKTPIERISEIGGGISMEEYALLTIDQSVNDSYTANLELKGQNYNVDLKELC